MDYDFVNRTSIPEELAQEGLGRTDDPDLLELFKRNTDVTNRVIAGGSWSFDSPLPLRQTLQPAHLPPEETSMRGIRRLFSLAVLGALGIVGSGCAVGNTHTFQYVPEPGPDRGEGRVVLLFSVEDLRKDILEDDEPPSWVGEQRSGYGIPFTVTTTGHKPFTKVVRETLHEDLESVGFQTLSVDESPSGRVAEVLEEQEAERGLAVVMRVFNSDTYIDIDVEWDFEATVFGPAGQPLAENRIQGKQELQGSAVNPPRAAKEKVPPFFYDLMRQLVVGDERMMEALTEPVEEPAPADEERRCTVEQILKMRDAGLSEEQIEAACGH